MYVLLHLLIILYLSVCLESAEETPIGTRKSGTPSQSPTLAFSSLGSLYQFHGDRCLATPLGSLPWRCSLLACMQLPRRSNSSIRDRHVINSP
ncbi:hypothetical protein FB45DRAFT_329767 [Roridomyces roridus]|uniref:Secreted protein n=1 Tax=Roridomyces roridus TaxID=1738132 RepID=A0AAD7FCN0_9AGAR|nr:hypothetical protein FB45DRAFT_329767 [Roridomyces roridus]